MGERSSGKRSFGRINARKAMPRIEEGTAEEPNPQISPRFEFANEKTRVERSRFEKTIKVAGNFRTFSGCDRGMSLSKSFSTTFPFIRRRVGQKCPVSQFA